MASKYAPKKSMRPRSRNDAKGMSPKVKESSTRSPDGEYVKKMASGGNVCRGMGAAKRGGNFVVG